MPAIKSRFSRALGQRRYRRVFIIVAEGSITEKEYFDLFRDDTGVHVKCLKNTNSVPPDQALLRIQKEILRNKLRKNDEAWVVMDKDSWPENDLVQLYRWSQTMPNYGFALSNPKFEYWLLLHFEDANNVTQASHCDTKLTKHVPNYNKHIDSRRFTRELICQAVERAKVRDTPKCADWPRKPGSTVYRLVEKILNP